MTSKLKIWLAVAFIVVFLAGAAVGTFGGALHARMVFTHGHGSFGADRMRQHLQRELQLTAEQAEKINPLLDRTAAELDAIRRDTAERVSQTMNDSQREIAPLLTPAQQERLQQMRERHLRMLERHGPGPMHGHRPRPND